MSGHFSFARYAIMAKVDNGLQERREPVRVGSGFEHVDGTIAVYLDALPVSGQLLLVPEIDLRAARDERAKRHS